MMSDILDQKTDSFTPPFRVGKKNLCAILDSKGLEVVVFPKRSKHYAQEFCDFINRQHYIIEIMNGDEQLGLYEGPDGKFYNIYKK